MKPKTNVNCIGQSVDVFVLVIKNDVYVRPESSAAVAVVVLERYHLGQVRPNRSMIRVSQVASSMLAVRLLKKCKITFFSIHLPMARTNHSCEVVSGQNEMGKDHHFVVVVVQPSQTGNNRRGKHA